MRKEILIQILLSILVLIIIISVYQKYFKKQLKENIITNKEDNTKKENTLINITYESIDKDGKKYIISAETGNVKEEEPDLIYMTNVNAKVFLMDESVIYINSLNAVYNTINYDTKFYKKVELKYLEHNILCENLNVFFKKNLIEAYNNLNYKNLDFVMFADKIEIDLLTKYSKIYNFNENNVIIKNKNIDGNN